MSSDFQRELGERLRTARQRVLLKQEELGAALSPPINRSTIANYEAGRRNIPLDVLVQMAQALELPVSELLPAALASTAPDPVQAEALQTIQQAFAQRPEIMRSVVEFVGLLLADESYPAAVPTTHSTIEAPQEP